MPQNCFDVTLIPFGFKKHLKGIRKKRKLYWIATAFEDQAAVQILKKKS